MKDHTLNIGATFLKFSHYFTQYKAYLTNYSDSRDKISEMMTKNQQFREFCNITREDARCKGLKVMDLMIEPIARIPRYKLLLERLLKNTPEGDDSEYDVITSALNKVKEIAMENNESVSESEAIRKNQSDMIELTMSLSCIDHCPVGRPCAGVAAGCAELMSWRVPLVAWNTVYARSYCVLAVTDRPCTQLPAHIQYIR